MARESTRSIDRLGAVLAPPVRQRPGPALPGGGERGVGPPGVGWPPPDPPTGPGWDRLSAAEAEVPPVGLPADDPWSEELFGSAEPVGARPGPVFRRRSDPAPVPPSPVPPGRELPAPGRPDDTLPLGVTASTGPTSTQPPPRPDDLLSAGGPDGHPADPLALLPPPSRLARLARRLLPVAWRGARLDPGRPGALVLALVAALAAVVAAVGVWTQRPQAEPVPALPAVAVDEPVAPAAAAAGPLVVSVSGKVARPGLVEVPAGARVADVLEAAGGALAGTDLSALNLARRIADGEQVAVGVPAPAAPGPAAAGADPAAAGAVPGAKVDLNAATLPQLDALPGVGPVMAQRILDWRTHNGRFARVEQLRDVEGIGERRFSQLRELVTV
jgi:competence protein ComEA